MPSPLKTRLPMHSCNGEEADNADKTKGPGEMALFAAASPSIAPRAPCEIPFVDEHGSRPGSLKPREEAKARNKIRRGDKENDKNVVVGKMSAGKLDQSPSIRR
jgi:hypothetical protein